MASGSDGENGRLSVSLAATAGYRRSRLGIRTDGGVQLSWAASGPGRLDADAGYRVRVGASPEAIADSGTMEAVWRAAGLRHPWVTYPEPLGSREERYWSVTAVDAAGDPVSSAIERFEAGLLHERDWAGPWIAARPHRFRRESWDPVPLLRREIELAGVPRAARIYATALGVYRLWLNGVELTADEVLRPGWTDYHVRVAHQTYDVTPLLRAGGNTIAVELARGWYAGRLGLQRQPGFYGELPMFRMQLDDVSDRARPVTLASSDAAWSCSTGAVIATDLLQGEVQDVRQEPHGWRESGFDDADWAAVQTPEAPAVAIVPQSLDSTRRHREFEGRLVHEHARGPVVFDFGQNLVGWTRLESRTLPRADVIVRHGEILTPDRLVWRDNLRGAFQEDRYTTGSSEPAVLEPRFTVHGFRYAEVWGLPSADEFGAYKLPDDAGIRAVALDGGIDAVGRFDCSDERLTALSRAVEWTVRDNFIEVITDCPQRDERLGWLGDAGVIAPTAAYHFDIAAFLSKFVTDAADSQWDDGSIRSYVPPVQPGIESLGAPGWADGFVRLVHLGVERYGDVTTARRNFDALRRYAEFLDESNPSGIRTERVGADFSDWLSLSEDPDEPPHPLYAYTGARSTSSKRVVATAHSIRTFDQLADIADRLGDAQQAAAYRRRAAEVREAYRAAFVDERGWIEGDTQTVYAQAIGYGILVGEDAMRAGRRLAEKVRETGHLTTGIHGIEHLLPALVATGHVDLAYEVLLREAGPSWLHMIAAGATTIWEKWDGIDGDGKLSTAEMNSFNHCALGAVGAFLFTAVAGIDVRDMAWSQTVVFEPGAASGLDWARASHRTAFGEAAIDWRRAGDEIVCDLAVAPSLQAVVRAPEGYRVRADADAAVVPGFRGATGRTDRPGTCRVVFERITKETPQ